MNKSKKATSIIEAIIVLLIVVTWVTWMYKIFIESTKLSDSTVNKIQAIQIAKQWIEWITNIRDTNWIRYSWDINNCWNTDINRHWANTCVWENTTAYDIRPWSYTVFMENDYSWNIEYKTIWSFWLWTYINDYKVWLNNWIYNQWTITEDLDIVFTREIIISYLEIDWITPWDSNDPKMKITSLVQWYDNTSTQAHKIELEQILTNWKQ